MEIGKEFYSQGESDADRVKGMEVGKNRWRKGMSDGDRDGGI